jgi:hypothetical protein
MFHVAACLDLEFNGYNGLHQSKVKFSYTFAMLIVILWRKNEFSLEFTTSFQQESRQKTDFSFLGVVE